MLGNNSEINLSESILLKSKVLAFYEIIGGLVGIGLTLYIIIKLTAFPTLLLFLLFIAFALYIFSIICGVTLLKNLKSGYKLSRFNQFLQIVNFSMLGFGFHYISGLFMTIGMDLSEHFNINVNWGTSSWNFDFNNNQGINYFSINIIAIIIAIFIDKQLKHLEKLDLDQKLSQLGDANPN